jgi:Fe-S-cluster-containing hydrogenase component 2
MVCPHGAIKTVMSLEKAFKCTLICGEKDNPPCVAVCDREALFFDDFSTTVKKRRNRKIRGLIKR